MGKYVIRWNRSAYLQMVSIAAWYRENVALKAASSFISDVSDAIHKISQCPTMGMLDRKRSNARYNYHSRLFHPKYRLIYRVSSNTLRIVAFQCNLQQKEAIH